ncbi:hypothetical protein SARC_14351, partial [Sphaeroforma arctica JP610]
RNIIVSPVSDTYISDIPDVAASGDDLAQVPWKSTLFGIKSKNPTPILALELGKDSTFSLASMTLDDEVLN